VHTDRHNTLLDTYVKGLLFYAHRVGRHRTACVAGIFALTIGLRCALLPWLPRPEPYIQDEFANLLGADTFISGRLTNPLHPLWQFFESGQIIVRPTYTMKYQPGQAAFLALGQVLAGDPYWGVVISTAMMAGAICWMMQGILQPGWALIGGLFTAIAFGGGHYWIQSYFGGSVTALASALMIGAFARIVHGRPHLVWLLALGSVLGLLTRPYETAVLAVILALALIVVHVRRRCWIALRKMAPTYISIMTAWVCFQAYYDWRITGNALKMPYVLHEEQYSPVPFFWMLPSRDAPKAADPPTYGLHWVYDKGAYDDIRSMSPLRRTLVLLQRAITAQAWRPGFHTTLPDLLGVLRYILIFAPVFWYSRRVRYLSLLAIPLALITCLHLWTYLHYLAPFIVTALALIFLLISCLRSLRVGGHCVGNVLVAMLLLYLPFEPLLIARSAIKLSKGGDDPYIDVPYKKEHARITAELERVGGRHVVIVRYDPRGSAQVDWVYNSANIDAQKIIWTRDLGDAQNQKLLNYYHDRRIWVLYPNETPARLEHYR
jgi:hypothetical protein